MDFSIMELKVDAELLLLKIRRLQWNMELFTVVETEDFNLPAFLFRFWIFFSELQSSLGLLSNLQSKDYLAYNLTAQLYFFSSCDTTWHTVYSGQHKLPNMYHIFACLHFSD